MGLRQITAPTAAPISIAEAKAHCHIDDDSQDAYIGGLILAATHFVDGPKGRLSAALMPQTWQITLRELPACGFKIPLPPLLGVLEIRYFDCENVDHILPSADYIVIADTEPGAVEPAPGVRWPAVAARPDAVRVVFRAGYEGAEDDSPPGPNGVPPRIKQAMLLLIGHWFHNREASAPSSTAALPLGVEALLGDHQVYDF